MIDHCSLSVTNYDLNITFYDETLKILGLKRMVNIHLPDEKISAAGYGIEELACFWISDGGSNSESIGTARGVHFAFKASSKEMIDKWHQKCLELGGKDNGAPGPRPHYHPGYYGAFIIDPNGWRIEAVYRENRV